MAIADSNTIARPEIEPAITTLLKTPLGNHLDLFEILDSCQFHIDALIENDNNTECMALCGRLLAALEMLKFTLNVPLPTHLIERLTIDVATDDNYRCPLSTDSETMRQYCAALTMLLLQRQQTAEQNEQVTGLLFELVNVLIEDLKTPRFVRTESGLVMMSGEAVPGIH
ncbi:hypothetical protein M975_3716 [Buttiauxella brennerae ATCC 51605]|uniref:Uncharacterized protein n=1 Tax=Buttiauxella brennerae ATCC 51605 TaxID=1354251 RepID=A0A1B7II17_9ENTR|nr:hypothetical protein [Buttiauxella brennerae]OAT29069.1 hypothetical protein M975_3716 [Buttiauxella brennerae ATCC 51605]